MLEITGKGVLGMRGGWENEIKIGVKINAAAVRAGAAEEKIRTRIVRRSPHHQSSLREKGWIWGGGSGEGGSRTVDSYGEIEATLRAGAFECLLTRVLP